MKYIYLDESGEQVGPVDESAVVQAILAGKLKADSAIRNALLREFCTVADFDCFADALAKAGQNAADGVPDARGGGFIAYLRRIAETQTEEEQSASISGSRQPGDASAMRRTLAMLLDAVVLLAVLLLFFGPALGRLKDLGTSDTAELARLETARAVRKTALKKAAKEQKEKAAAAPTAPEAPKPENAVPDRPHDTRRALVNMVAPNALKKLDRSYAQHNAAVERAASGDRKKTPPAGRKRPAQRPAPPPESTEPKADVPPPTPPAPPETAIENKPVRPPKKLRPEDMPQVVFRDLPGMKWLVRAFPALSEQAENRVLDAPDGLPGWLITGCAADDADIRLRIGADVRQIPRAEFRANFAGPVKWAVLVILLYYTLAFSIFAQTLGMWFWGIFLTRSKVAEVLPFRAALYTACMLLFGILMIPMVLITKRSLADWLCGVRQIGVGSVSKS